MGILSLLPPELITFLTWLVLFISASALILIIAVGFGRLLGGFVDDILGWIK
jgi:ABC-type antimicrobial peptide transport system permease subunit